jgi:hypothetical protein
MLHVVTWWWGDKYPAHYVERLRDGLRRHLRQPYRLLCMVDRLLERPALTGVGYRQILDHDLIAQPGCFARLRMFDRDWQFAREIAPEERIGCIDLDCVVTGPLDPLFDRPESFVILQGANAANPCPVNGSLMMLRGAAHQDVWSDFSLEAARQVPFHEFPDDQGWIAHKLPGCAGWQAGPGQASTHSRSPAGRRATICLRMRGSSCFRAGAIRRSSSISTGSSGTGLHDRAGARLFLHPATSEQIQISPVRADRPAHPAKGRSGRRA